MGIDVTKTAHTMAGRPSGEKVVTLRGFYGFMAQSFTSLFFIVSRCVLNDLN